MTIRSLEIFQAVCRTGSVTQAAKELYLAQPAVSHAITQLEEELGVHLFDRIARRLYLTAAGKLLLHKARGLLDLYADFTETAKTLEDAAPLRVGCSITLANFFLPKLLSSFHTQSPGTPVQVMVDNARAVEAALMESRCDLALIEGVISEEALVRVPLSAYPLSFFCATRHPFAGKRVGLDALLREKLLLRETGSSIRDAFDSALLLHDRRVSPAFVSVDSGALIQGAAQGLGVGLLPQVLLEDALALGAIAKFTVKGMNLTSTNHLVYHRDKYQTPAFAAFLTLCKETAALL